jgi:hypothetical protein
MSSLRRDRATAASYGQLRLKLKASPLSVPANALTDR